MNFLLFSLLVVLVVHLFLLPSIWAVSPTDRTGNSSTLLSRFSGQYHNTYMTLTRRHCQCHARVCMSLTQTQSTLRVSLFMIFCIFNHIPELGR